MPFIPFGVKVYIDGPPNEDIVIWVRDDQTDEQAATLIGECLTGVDLKRHCELSLFAS
ncbi:hypothetical protein [Actinacidiphila sp. ITFR-21]|uniref:hypothetical protein n=1 Tax=Actinacidiphila sp. ITFR-21 TaxID=3075199 RepID=UPI002888FEF7|nr:hypothetical protein [Streptomyces sp. ITFR-21]WNI19116.1 hypothetical protein RLT57_28670 [Streptomyces sp. ITFR-21]